MSNENSVEKAAKTLFEDFKQSCRQHDQPCFWGKISWGRLRKEEQEVWKELARKTYGRMRELTLNTWNN